MIGIVDYGMGNLFSVSKALERLKAPYFISSNTDELKKATGYILPGVGAFKDAMFLLNETGLATLLKEEVTNGKPLFGICLGMQLLFDESEENGQTKGLGFLSGRIKRMIIPSLKVPHMGWNKLTFHKSHELLNGLEEDYAYFVHSYYAVSNDSDIILASAEYGVLVPAIVGKGPVVGTQFHPEKSSALGIAILRNFIQMVEGEK
ncbi:imidazole glycerol phosphate synthase subunit HisH [Bacillus sp. FJAT-47783]|uniref:imidazole glycerol phosphate synthase subunit HisH n=1 Tax=Bacillus sp. FJAT-47783 TaxID=2922712 RepID=UPI001FAE395D|nr:imidazole glycerol phosphate synthase subunit HisH [Bacillus sp. FJAT-47783]